MRMKAWHFIFLHDFLESNTLGIKFKCLLLLITVTPPISLSSLEALLKANYPFLIHKKYSWMNTLSQRPNLETSKKRKIDERRFEEENTIGLHGNYSTKIFIYSFSFLTNSSQTEITTSSFIPWISVSFHVLSKIKDSWWPQRFLSYFCAHWWQSWRTSQYIHGF